MAILRAAALGDDPSPDRTLSEALERLLEAVFRDEPALGRHCLVVAHCASRLAAAAALSDREQEVVHIGGLLHDLDHPAFRGAAAIRLGRRDLAVGALVERHRGRGAGLLREIPGMRQVADVVASCHEHFDGTGRPSGRTANEIPHIARILAVADHYAAVTCPEDPDIDAADHADGAVALRRAAGRRLDPQLVDLFLAAVADRDAALPRSLRSRLHEEVHHLREHGIFGGLA